ncbi:MAG: DUF1330 domain-containing protein [Proteobacteria bacterium]|nr:DUF1330 domain-containing protein [Pseudomonadota bacterium]
MTAYVVVDIDVTDPVRYDQYKQLAQVAIPAHGGRYLARGGRSQVLEGAWNPKRLVVLQFDSIEAAVAWHRSSEYGAAIAARTGAADVKMVVVEGA